MKVLVLSSSMGAGHDGSGRELMRRLEAEGHEARMHDYLDALPLRIGHFIRWNYELQLRYAPWSYENSYHLWPRMYGLLVFLNGFLARRRLDQWMKKFPPDVIVSNNPLATLAIGRLRQKGAIKVPCVTTITDFGVHPLWVHPGIDLHLAVHPVAAEVARQRSGGGRAEAPGPLVSERFRSVRPDRRLARLALGLLPGERAVLVVAGSWGVGDVEETARLLLASRRYTPITVCGRDAKLKARLEAAGLGIVIGWTDDMPSLMAAADALVENAGGLTSMEAFASGLPVVTFKPIPGHGHDNADAMARAGVTKWPASDDELLEVLDQVTVDGPARRSLIEAGQAMFAGDAAADVLGVADPVSAPLSLAAARRRRRVRQAASVAVASAGVYVTMTAGVAVASQYGLTVPSNAHPRRSVVMQGVSRPVTYLGVRLNAAELADPTVRASLLALHPTAIVTSRTAESDAADVRTLAEAGVDVATGGCGAPKARVLPERRDVSSVRTIDTVTGVRASAYVPARPVDALDLLWAQRRHLSIVVPNHTFVPGRLPVRLDAGESYVLDGRSSTPGEVASAIQALETTAGADGTVLTGLRAFE